uniref:Uncharacterized protein n=1 Tax=Apteryx owenii TaxID=8824 RepID=A0A8B9PKN9_APTOW
MGLNIREDQDCNTRLARKQHISLCLLVKLYQFLACQTNSSCNKVVLKLHRELSVSMPWQAWFISTQQGDISLQAAGKLQFNFLECNKTKTKQKKKEKKEKKEGSSAELPAHRQDTKNKLHSGNTTSEV